MQTTNQTADVALYSRVSSDRQDVDLSISAQLKALREYCARKGYRIVREFVDSAESGRTAYRPQFREMISLARRPDKPIRMILIYKYSRFARSREDSIVYKALLKKCGVQVISITEPVDDTAMGKLMQAIIEAIDEFYSENLGEEVTRGLRESASRGFYLSARAPYGYKKVRVNDGGKERTKLEIDEFKSKVVRTIYDRILEGKGLKEIAKELNSRAIPSPRGNTWSNTSVRFIAASEINTGTIVWGRNSKRGLPPIRVPDGCPPIVTVEEHMRAQTAIKSRSFVYSHPRRTSSPYLLSGLVKCGYCGKALVGASAKSGKFAYYVCGNLNKKGAGVCQCPYLNTTKLDNLVVSKIRGHVLTPVNLSELARLVADELNSKNIEYEAEIDPLRAEIALCKRKLERLYDVVEEGKVSIDDLAPRIKERKDQLEKLLARIADLERALASDKAEAASEEEMIECAKDLKGLLDKGSISERRSFIRSFVKEIRVTGDEAKLSYTLPMFPSGKAEELVPVLGIEQYGGR